MVSCSVVRCDLGQLDLNFSDGYLVVDFLNGGVASVNRKRRISLSLHRSYSYDDYYYR